MVRFASFIWVIKLQTSLEAFKELVRARVLVVGQASLLKAQAKKTSLNTGSMVE